MFANTPRFPLYYFLAGQVSLDSAMIKDILDGNEKMPIIPKKTKLIVLIVFVIFTLSFLIEPSMKTRLGFHSDSVSAESLTIMKVVGILLSVYGLIVPWIIKPLLSRKTWMISQLRQETLILLLGYISLISPVIYGLILFNFGIPLEEFYYF
jgi:hypothetical protein